MIISNLKKQLAVVIKMSTLTFAVVVLGNCGGSSPFSVTANQREVIDENFWREIGESTNKPSQTISVTNLRRQQNLETNGQTDVYDLSKESATAYTNTTTYSNEPTVGSNLTTQNNSEAGFVNSVRSSINNGTNDGNLATNETLIANQSTTTQSQYYTSANPQPSVQTSRVTTETQQPVELVVPDGKPSQRNVTATVVAKPVNNQNLTTEVNPVVEQTEKVASVEDSPVQSSVQLNNEHLSSRNASTTSTEDLDEKLFRWPVSGRIIDEFGPKADGDHNDGINLAVPEGTPVRSTEDGTVIYSGNELKGYGNLLLIRHDDGWVSAYAHNKELNVKRGDVVRRGDVVASAGSTGSVNQPQLHFELRRGNKPVNPLIHLPNE